MFKVGQIFVWKNSDVQVKIFRIDHGDVYARNITGVNEGAIYVMSETLFDKNIDFLLDNNDDL